MFNHEYDYDGYHRITYMGPSSDPRAHEVSGPWASYHMLATLNMGSSTYAVFTTYNYPARSPEHTSLQYPGPYADVVYQLLEVK
jgi:hypothetical protein